MEKKNLEVAQAYYGAINSRDLEKASSYLHDDVQLISPFCVVEGKDDFVQALGKFVNEAQGVNLRAQFASDDEVMLAFDLKLDSGPLRSAALMCFLDGKIVSHELFFDTRHLGAPQEQVFEQS